MDSGVSDGQALTMEVDGGGDASAMDTTDEPAPPSSEHNPWADNGALDMTKDLPMAQQLYGGGGGGGMVVSQTMQDEEGEERGAKGEATRPSYRSWLLAEGACEKHVMERGEGMQGPVMGSSCTTTILLLDSSSTDLHPDPAGLVGHPLGHTQTLEVGEGGTAVSTLLDMALTSMKKGETAHVCVSRVRRGLEDGGGGGGGGEGEATLTLMFRVTLHDFTTAVTPPPWRLSPEEKCASAAARKEKGAQLFREGKVYAAFAQFRMATRLLLSILPFSLEQEDDDDNDDANDDERKARADKRVTNYKQLLCQCYLNLAACQLKSAQHSHVVENCTQALGMDPTNVKALFRRASAQLALGNVLRAQEDLEQGLSLQPHNTALLELQQTVIARLAPSQTRMAQGLSKMFS